jgi:hypothetical protein
MVTVFSIIILTVGLTAAIILPMVVVGVAVHLIGRCLNYGQED